MHFMLVLHQQIILKLQLLLYDGGFGAGSTDVARAIYEAYFNKVEKTPNFPQEFPITAQREVDTP